MILFHKPFYIFGAMVFKMDKWRWGNTFCFQVKTWVCKDTLKFKGTNPCRIHYDWQGLTYMFLNFMA